MEQMESGQGAVDPCDALLNACAAEIGVTIEAMKKSSLRDELLAMLERVAMGKIRAATEAERRVADAIRAKQMRGLMNGSQQLNAHNNTY